jgi:hypothetical protein
MRAGKLRDRGDVDKDPLKKWYLRQEKWLDRIVATNSWGLRNLAADDQCNLKTLSA